MLVLRKEMKMFVGIGAAVLGIAGVYGLMALLSSGNGSHGTSSSEPPAVASTDSGGSTSGTSSHGLDSAVSGLPPKDDNASAKLPVPPNDPFAESNRNDGSKADPWALALATGKVDVPVIAAVNRSQPVIVSVPKPGAKPAVGDDIKMLDRINFGIGANIDPANTSKQPNNPSTGEPSKYVIKSGDTFSTIAVKEYGSKRFVSAIVAANPNIDPRRLRPGTEISLPSKDSATARGTIEPESTKIASPIDASRQYRVEAGDTLHHIALKLYHKSSMWEEIYDANKQEIGADAGKLKVGMLLKLPKPAEH